MKHVWSDRVNSTVVDLRLANIELIQRQCDLGRLHDVEEPPLSRGRIKDILMLGQNASNWSIAWRIVTESKTIFDIGLKVIWRSSASM